MDFPFSDARYKPKDLIKDAHCTTSRTNPLWKTQKSKKNYRARTFFWYKNVNQTHIWHQITVNESLERQRSFLFCFINFRIAAYRRIFGSYKTKMTNRIWIWMLILNRKSWKDIWPKGKSIYFQWKTRWYFPISKLLTTSNFRISKKILFNFTLKKKLNVERTNHIKTTNAYHEHPHSIHTQFFCFVFLFHHNLPFQQQQQQQQQES